MILSDQHMHSCFSGDSKSEISDMIDSAISKNLMTICFTDHYDPLFPCYREGEQGIFDLDTVKYMQKAAIIRENDDIQSKIKVRFGVELGIYPGIYDTCKDIINASPYDFVILSSHTANKEDPYRPEYWEGIDPVKGITMYFEEILENVRNFKDFDVYGHLDYCVRYTETTPEQIKLSNYKDIISEIFRILIENGKGIEINSGGLRRKKNEFNPNPEILSFYKECGGEIITFGSDAHIPSDIAYGIDKASDLLNSIGFKYIAEFKERKPEFIRI